VTVPARKAAPVATGRIPAKTIRALRRFHGLDQLALAEAFQVSTRTVIRWEQKGIHPDLLPRETGSHRMPDWRQKLLHWMLRRFELTGSPDNQKKAES
jgi:hypothetical protein